MSTYYISNQRGNDENNGTSPSTPFATIGKAGTVVAAGDTVYIGPGTYRERVVLTTVGTLSDPIWWIPDPQAVEVTGDTPGLIRVTTCDNDEKLTAGNSWTNVSYNHIGNPDKKFGQILIDGSLDLTCVLGTSTCKTYGVTAFGYQGFYYGQHYYALAFGTRRGIRSSISINSIAMGSDFGFTGSGESGVICKNCVAMSGYCCFSNDENPIEVTNCIAAGGTIGFRGAICKNSIAVSCSTGFRHSDLYELDLTKCTTYLCRTGYRNDSEITSLDVSDCKDIGSYEVLSGAGVGMVEGIPSTGPITVYDLFKLAELFMPIIHFNANDGDSDVDMDFDILGQVRKLGSGVPDRGVIESSLVSLDYLTNKETTPSLKLGRKSMQKFIFWAKGGEEFTKEVWVMWVYTDSSLKPQVIIDGDHISRTVVTATGDGSAWEKLEISATPSADGEIELYLYSRDINDTSLVHFCDLI
jgi:hypothetical protein